MLHQIVYLLCCKINNIELHLLRREIVKNKKAVLNTNVLKWMDKVKYPGNFIIKNCKGINDCNSNEKSLLIGNVIKLGSNFGKLQSSVLITYLSQIVVHFMGLIYGNLIC